MRANSSSRLQSPVLLSPVLLLAALLAATAAAPACAAPRSFRWGRAWETGHPRSNLAAGVLPATGTLLEFGGWTEEHATVDPPLRAYALPARAHLPVPAAGQPQPRSKPFGALVELTRQPQPRSQPQSQREEEVEVERMPVFAVGLGAANNGTVFADTHLFVPHGDGISGEWAPLPLAGGPSARIGARATPILAAELKSKQPLMTMMMRQQRPVVEVDEDEDDDDDNVQTSDSVLVFAGQSQQGMEADLHLLDVRARRWASLPVAEGSAVPEGRSEHAQCRLAGGQGTGDAFMAIFGGVRWHRQPRNHLNDVWVLGPAPASAAAASTRSSSSSSSSLPAVQWTQLFERTEDPAKAPQPRVGPTIVPSSLKNPTHLIVFGGYGAGEEQQGHYYNDVWTFSLSERVFVKETAAGTAPLGRWAHFAQLLHPHHPAQPDSTNPLMLVAGGYSDRATSPYFDDILHLEWEL